MKALSQPVILAPATFALFLLFAPVQTWADTADVRLRDLAARASDRHTWLALRRYAATQSNAETRGRAHLVLGYREYDAGEFEAAIQDLRAAAETGFSLADHARFYWGDAAFDAREFGQVLEALDGFTARYPGSTLRRAAVELLAKALLEVDQPARAVELLTRETHTRRRPELSMLLARAFEATGNATEAARLYQEIFYAFPLSSQADEVRETLQALRAQLGAGFPEVSDEIQGARAELLARRSRWQEALDEFTGLIESWPGSPLVPRWKVGRARCLLGLREWDQAIDLLTTGIKPTPDVDPERLGFLVEAYLRKEDPVAAEIVIQQLGQLYPQSPTYAGALDAFGNYHVRRGDWKVAARYYQLLAEVFPTTSRGEEAQWRVSWFHYLEGDLYRAREGFAEHLRRYPRSNRVTGALYWLARIEEQRGAASEPLSLYGFLRDRYAQTYYARQAEARLRELRGTAAAEARPALAFTSLVDLTQRLEPRPAPPISSCVSSLESTLPGPFLVLRDLSLTALAEQYLEASLEDHPDSVPLRLALSGLHAEQGRHALAFFEARRAVPRYMEYDFAELPADLWQLLFPQEFMSLIRRHARAKGLDLHLVLGLIRQESAFNPRATSVANARGLMQILPQTVSRTRRGRARAARRLYEPAYNIQFGSRHLRALMTSLGEVPEYGLAAYHAGQTRVKEWLSQRAFQEPAEFLETVPIPATRHYVEAVLRDAAIYRQLLAGAAKPAKCQ